MNDDQDEPTDRPKSGANMVVKVLLRVVAFVILAVLLVAGTCAVLFSRR
jgi:hypothetical protein